MSLCLTLTACQIPPKFISQAFNSQDPCQKVGKSDNYTRPNWCGAGDGTVYTVRENLSRQQVIVTRN